MREDFWSSLFYVIDTVILIGQYSSFLPPTKISSMLPYAYGKNTRCFSKDITTPSAFGFFRQILQLGYAIAYCPYSIWCAIFDAWDIILLQQREESCFCVQPWLNDKLMMPYTVNRTVCCREDRAWMKWCGCCPVVLCPYEVSSGIDTQEDEQENGEAP